MSIVEIEETRTADKTLAAPGTPEVNASAARDATRSRSPIDCDPLLERFAPVFDRIAEGAADREQSRTLAYEAVRWLVDAGYTTLRVPKRFGGEGISLLQFFRLTTRLGEADPNLPQILRIHGGFIELLLEGGDTAAQARWFKEITDGKVFSGAVSERTETTNNSVRLTRRGNAWQLDGAKFYTTGSLYADWLDVSANDGETDVKVLIRADAQGVERIDDWDGFGQRLTSSGTVRFDAVVVPPENIHKRFDARQPRRHTIQTAYFQQVHLANLAGITRAILRDAVAFTRAKTRTFGVPGQSKPADNPLVQRVVGRLASLSYSTQTLADHIARRLDDVVNARAEQRTSEETYIDLDIEVFQAQQIILEQTLQAATLLFEVGGATATSVGKGLDRHWRNARVLASHNPATLREAMIGAFHLNGEPQQERFGVGLSAPAV